jgi:hypothetical protein
MWNFEKKKFNSWNHEIPKKIWTVNQKFKKLKKYEVSQNLSMKKILCKSQNKSEHFLPDEIFQNGWKVIRDISGPK